jgi:hypothetical protein
VKDGPSPTPRRTADGDFEKPKPKYRIQTPFLRICHASSDTVLALKK